MKKPVYFLFIVVCCNFPVFGQNAEKIKLPEPQKTGGMELMEAFRNRRSQRSFSKKKLPLQLVSNLLWAAYGVNRPGDKRTVPGAMGWYEFDIYLVQPDGWFRFNPLEHSLTKLGEEDLRQFACTQDFGQTAPLNLVYVANYSRMTNAEEAVKQLYAAKDVGFISQNVYLFCASEGLATVVRASTDKENLRKKMNLLPEQHVVLGQTIGYPAE